MSVCVISRDQNNEIQEVYAPNNKPSILFRDILASLGGTTAKITQEDRVIFGHPTIGKSYLKEKGDNRFITLDDDYAHEVNEFIDAHRGDETRQQYKGRKPKEYNEFMLNLFDRLKIKAEKEGKMLFVSNTNILKERMASFDKVITIPKDEFKKRFDARGATYGFEDWKSDIDATVARVDKSKVISTTGYLSDLFGSSKELKESAIRIWARAYTPSFKKKFGDWELLSEAKKYFSKVSPIYKDMITVETQHTLYEAAVQGNSSESEKKGATMVFGKELMDIAMRLFPNAKVGEKYQPVVTVPLDENGEPTVESILNRKEKNQKVTRVELQEDPIEFQTPQSALSRIAETSQWEANRAIAQQLLSYNYGDLKIIFDDMITDFGRWYHDNSKVLVSRERMRERAEGDMDKLQYFEETTILHELAHSLTFHAIENNPRYRAKLQELYDKSYDHVKDLYSGEPNLHEFIAEALTNPFFQKALKEIPHQGTLKNVWNALVDMIKRMANFYKLPVSGTVLDEVLNLTFPEIENSQRSNKRSSGSGFSQKTTQAVAATPQTWGSRVTIEHFEQKQQNIKLEESGDISYYTNGTIDPITNTLKKFTRLTEYTHAQFANTQNAGKFDPEKWLDQKTSEVFRKANAPLTDKIPYGNYTDPQSYDEIKADIKRSFEESRYRGKIMHKMIEGYIKHGDLNYFSDDISNLRTEGGIAEHDLLWFGENEVRLMLKKIGINTAEFGNTDIKFRDNIASELMMISEELGIGTSNDGFIEHSDGSISFMDYKTGSKFLADENTIRKMQYTNGLASPIYDSKLDRAKIELVMRMIIAKMGKPDLKVRDLKIAYISRYYGTQIRYVNVQEYLDYINNNMKITIQELQKEVKKDPSLKDKLEQKKREYKAMQDAKVFDFHNYQGENKIFEQDSDLETITDPKKKLEYLKNRVANEARQSLINDREGTVSRQSLKKVKESLYAVLNSFKSANITDVRAEGTKDISWFAAKTMGLRDQANAFLQSISTMFEEATDRSTRKMNELLGEQSEFRKADRALYKEYTQKRGGITTAVKTFSYSQANTPVPANEQGIFDFMYTWKNVAGEMKRVGAVYTEQDFRDGKITEAQWNYYKASKKVLKEVYENVRNKVAYVNKFGKAITYGQEYKKAGGYSFEAFQESFLPTIPFQNVEEIIEKNIATKNLSPVKITKEFFENYTDRYDLAIQNEDRFNIGMPLKYMSSEFLENDEHSYNVSRAVDIFARHMINKFELDDVYDIGKTTIAAMSDTTDPNMKDAKGQLHLQNSIFALESFLNQHIKGERRKTLNYWGKKNEVANKRTDLVLDNIGGFISKNAFWFAPVTSTFNGLYGLITNGREGLIGSLSKRLFGDDNAVTLSHILKATSISGVHQARNLTVQGNIKRQFHEDFEGTYYRDKVNFMMKMFRLNNKSYNYADNSLALGVHNRIMTGDNAYVAQGLGEDLSNETLVIASMLAMKVSQTFVDANGNEVKTYLKKDGTYTRDKNDKDLQNMWDAYEMNDTTGEFEYKGPVRFKDKDGNDVTGLTTMEALKIKTYLERMYGAYSPEQKTHLERYGLGRMAMKFRKFWITNIRENFTVNSYQKYVGEYVMMRNADGTPKLKDGQPMYTWQAEHMKARVFVIAALLKSFAGMQSGKSWNQMSIEEKKQATRMMFQLAFLGFAIAMGMGAVFPPEDKDKLYVKRFTRLAEDLSAIHPLDLIRGTTTIDSYPTQLYKAAKAVFAFFHSIATDDVVESGEYKGDLKGWNTVEDFIPVYHSMNQADKLIEGK